MKKINLTIISSLVAFAVFSASSLAQDIFEPIINKLLSLGILNAMLLFLFAAIDYALLKKSKIFGESEILNGVVAFIIAFLIFIFPFITGVSLVNPISIFFTQSIVIIIFLMIGFIMASFFYPDMPKVLADQFTRRSTLYVMIGLGLILFIIILLVATSVGRGGG